MGGCRAATRITRFTHCCSWINKQHTHGKQRESKGAHWDTYLFTMKWDNGWLRIILQGAVISTWSMLTVSQSSTHRQRKMSLSAPAQRAVDSPQSIIPLCLHTRRPWFKDDLLVTVSQAHQPLYSETTSAHSPSITTTPTSPVIHPSCVCLTLVSALTLLHGR